REEYIQPQDKATRQLYFGLVGGGDPSFRTSCAPEPRHCGSGAFIFLDCACNPAGAWPHFRPLLSPSRDARRQPAVGGPGSPRMPGGIVPPGFLLPLPPAAPYSCDSKIFHPSPVSTGPHISKAAGIKSSRRPVSTRISVCAHFVASSWT